MKRLLLDTHVFLWFIFDDESIGEHAKSLIEAAENEVYVSAASAWEIAIKKHLGKLDAPSDIEHVIEQNGFEALNVTPFHGEKAGELADHHKDPFDRMLVAQAQAHGLTIITSDSKIPEYGIPTLDARR